MLDVQKYPDLREYPGGPPERPYDAAGWTLPLAMGVRVVPATTPLGDDVRAKMKMIGPAPEPKVKPTPYDASPRDAAAFDSVPGAGFDTEPGAAAILPPAGKIDGSGPLLILDPAQNNTFRAINKAWQQGASVSVYLESTPSPACPQPRKTIWFGRSRFVPSASALASPAR